MTLVSRIIKNWGGKWSQFEYLFYNFFYTKKSLVIDLFTLYNGSGHHLRGQVTNGAAMMFYSAFECSRPMWIILFYILLLYIIWINCLFHFYLYFIFIFLTFHFIIIIVFILFYWWHTEQAFWPKTSRYLH